MKTAGGECDHEAAIMITNNKNTNNVEDATTSIIDLLQPTNHNYNVYLVRGKQVEANPGNIYYRELISLSSTSYSTTKCNRLKQFIAQTIVNKIYQKGGCFICCSKCQEQKRSSKVNCDHSWDTITKKRVIDTKVKQALRDHYNNSKKAKTKQSERSMIMNSLRRNLKTIKNDDDKNTIVTPTLLFKKDAGDEGLSVPGAQSKDDKDEQKMVTDNTPGYDDDKSQEVVLHEGFPSTSDQNVGGGVKEACFVSSPVCPSLFFALSASKNDDYNHDVAIEKFWRRTGPISDDEDQEDHDEAQDFDDDDISIISFSESEFLQL